MAVEIPVVIDIDKAFQDAANRVSSAIKPMKAAIEDATANLQLKIGSDAYGMPIKETLKKILTDVQKGKSGFIGMRYSVDELGVALDDASNRLNRMLDLERQGQNINLTRKRELEEAIALLTQEVEQRGRGSMLIQQQTRQLIEARRAEEERMFIISQEAKTISEMTSRLSALRGQLQNAMPGSAEWRKTASEIVKATEAIAKYESSLTRVTTKAGSINRMSAEMRELERRWDAMSKAQKFDKDGNLKASAQKIIDKYKQLSLEADRYGQSLAQLAGKGKAGLIGVNNELVKQGGLWRSLMTYASMYLSLFGAMRFVKQIKEVTGELEYQRVALGHLIQDEEYGAQLFEKIKKAALESPFRITQLVTYTKQLAAYRVEQEDLFDVTKRLADISAGLGVDMNRLILAYGQVRAASVLRGQELRQFTEAGIPLVELLAEKFTELRGTLVSTADVFKLISERAVPFSMIADIFEDLTDKGGMFYEMQKIQADTLKGRWEKLKDAFDLGLQSIGESKGLLSFRTELNLLLKVLNVLAKNLRLIPKLIEGGTLAWLAYKAALLVTGNVQKKTIALQTRLTAMQAATAAGAKAGTLAHSRLTAAYLAQNTAANALTRTLARLRIAMWSNPLTAAISAVLGLATVFLSFRKNVDAAAQSTQDMEQAIEGMNRANSRAAKEEKMIEGYSKLASKTERTAEENEKLAETMFKLKEAYPDLIDQIGNENVALGDQISALKDAREAKLKMARDEAQQRLAIEESKNRELKAKQKEAQEQYLEAYADFSKKAAEATQDFGLASALAGDLLGDEFADMISSKPFDDAEKKARETADAARAGLDEINKELTQSDKLIARLKAQINPKEAEKDLSEWQNELLKIQNTMLKFGDSPLFTPEDVKNFDSVYDMSKKLKKAMDDLTVSIAGMKAIYESMAEGAAKDALGGEIAQAENQLKIAQAIKDAFSLTFKTASKQSTGTDPFVTLMQNRIKFMQDFRKGYEELNKYVNSTKARQQEAEIMLGRGQSLGLDATEQMRAVADLTNWYQEMIDKVQGQLRAKGIKGATPTDFLSVDTTKKSKAIQDLQKLLQSLWDAKTDYDTSQKKKDIEDALKKLSDEIKQTETARNFYRDILDLTGDEGLAATIGISVYGDIGREFKDRMQQQLNAAMNSLDADQLTDELRKAFASQDFGVILQNLDKFPEEWQKRVKEMAETSQKFEADRAKDLLKALQRSKTYAEQQVELAKQTAKRTADIQAMEISSSVKSQLLKQNAQKEAEESAKIAYEAFKDTPMYVELFSDLDQASVRMLTNMRENLEKMKENWKNLHPRELKELQSRLNELDEQIAQRNPFKALANSIKEYYDMRKDRSRVEVEEAAIAADEKLKNEEALLQKYRQEYMAVASLETVDKALVEILKQRMDEQAKIVDKAKDEADEAQEAANNWKKVAKAINDSADKMQEWAGYVSGSLDGIQEIVGTFASDDFAETFGIIAEGLGKTVSGTAQLGKGIAELMTGNPQGLVDTFQGLGNVISGTFGSAKQLSIKKLNKKIDEQQDLLDGLTYSYDRLEKAMAKAFGSDYIYNYNEQLKNLQAQQAAYEEQLRLEQNKGKKKDKDKIQDYEDSIQEVKDQIMDMSGGLSEFFTGTDVKSAAEEFANSWIEAYKSFSSTTGAMRERFQEMIGNMITQSLAGQMMQRLLQPIFDEIDRLSEDGELTAAEIGSISDMAIAAIPQIDNAMTGLVNNLAGAGINLRQQAGQFTGISRDIAGASEESILGLAAAVNTANYYISHVPTISENVAAIREALTGESGGGRRNVATRGEAEGPTYEDQMLIYASAIPTMRDDMAVMRSLLERVIKPVGVSATHYVAVR